MSKRQAKLLSGELFLEIAPFLACKPNGANEYNWRDKKISLKLAVLSIDSICSVFNGIIPWYKSSYNNKTIDVQANPDLSVCIIVSTETNKLEISLNKIETFGLNNLLQRSKERMYAW